VNDNLSKDLEIRNKQLEEIKVKESHLKMLNKVSMKIVWCKDDHTAQLTYLRFQTLQEEIRKFSRPNYAPSNHASPPNRSDSHLGSSESSPPSARMSLNIPRNAPATGTPPEVNIEYLKNVLIKFIEDKRTRVS